MSKDQELFRVFDSLEYEDIENDKMELNFGMQGSFDGSQTKELAYLDCT